MLTTYERILKSSAYQSAKRQLIDALRTELAGINAPRPAFADLKKSYEDAVNQVASMRGRELFFKYIGSGAGNGPFVELADGSVKYDLITGIGVNFFGHGNLDLFEAEIDGLWCDVMQGNLGPNPEYGALMKALLESVEPRSRLKHAWLTTCGATANEIALKVIRQKKYPASRVMAFRNCFAGRTTALQEITDNPKYREGQPTYGEVHYLHYYSPKSNATAAQQAACIAAGMKEELARQPGRYCCLELELVQGEGGFEAAPREFILPILEQAREAGLAIWVDEIQTFGRTGEIFCFQRLGLDELVDVVTAAKMLQVGAVLYTGEYNPKAGLVSGTFAGSSSGLRAGLKALELLRGGLCGPKGRIRQLERAAAEELARIKEGPNGKHVVDFAVTGGMIAFTLYDGSLDRLKKFLFKLWELGAIAFYCGHGPYRARMLAPFGAMTEAQLRDAFRLVERAIGEAAT